VCKTPVPCSGTTCRTIIDEIAWQPLRVASRGNRRMSCNERAVLG
jgi:hypothetical protein